MHKLALAAPARVAACSQVRVPSRLQTPAKGPPKTVEGREGPDRRDVRPREAAGRRHRAARLSPSPRSSTRCGMHRSRRSKAIRPRSPAYKGKALMLVNVASKCGNTPQYATLEALQKKYEAEGLHRDRLPVQSVRRPGAGHAPKKSRRSARPTTASRSRSWRRSRSTARAVTTSTRRSRRSRATVAKATSSGTSKSSSSAPTARRSRGSRRAPSPTTRR